MIWGIQYVLYSYCLIQSICLICVSYAQDQVDGISLQQYYFNVLKGFDPSGRDKKMPNLDNIGRTCSRRSFYFSMNPDHMRHVADIKQLLIETPSTMDALNMAIDIRNRPEVNPRGWYRALSEFAYCNPGLQSIHKPSPIEMMPDVFINSDVLRSARRQFDGVVEQSDAEFQSCVILDETQTKADNNVENQLWYFREDIFLNAHHYLYHIANPVNPIFRPDRRGELFYYKHHSMLARYNADRFANGMKKVKPLAPIFGVNMEEGYSSHLMDSLTGQSWSDRRPFTQFTDIKHLQNPARNKNIFVNDLIASMDRINAAIDKGIIQHANGKQTSLSSWRAIDALADIIQASRQSVNPGFYGLGDMGLHNNGHLLLSAASDPSYQYQLPPGVMGDEATSARDPIFYRWHAFIDGIFEKYKNKFTPYTPIGGEFPLLWKGVRITDLAVFSLSARDNELETFYNYKKLRLRRGLDFSETFNPEGNADICVKHLDHNPFGYRLIIERDNYVMSRTSKATIRIFMAPKFNDVVTLAGQRPFLFVVDTFSVILRPGRNEITRQSIESSLTVPWTKSLNIFENGFDVTSYKAFCGCGWPEHLLLPKGNTNGMLFDLFAMATDGDIDEVMNDPNAPSTFCKSAYLMCGIPGRVYPDARPMGYPFDRLPFTILDAATGKQTAPTLAQYVKEVPNMAKQSIRIKHLGKVNSNRCCKEGPSFVNNAISLLDISL